MRILEEADLREMLFLPAPGEPLQEKLEWLLRESLSREGSLCLRGVGTFRLLPDRRIQFERWTRKRVFLAYACEDRSIVRTIYRFLARQGLDPWMDSECLLPGQNWPRAIERSIEMADFVVPCFSRVSCRKRGHFQAELRYALDFRQRMPLDSVYIVPVRLDECAVPRRIQREAHYIDLFPRLEEGLERLAAGLLAVC